MVEESPEASATDTGPFQEAYTMRWFVMKGFVGCLWMKSKVSVKVTPASNVTTSDGCGWKLDQDSALRIMQYV